MAKLADAPDLGNDQRGNATQRQSTPKRFYRVTGLLLQPWNTAAIPKRAQKSGYRGQNRVQNARGLTRSLLVDASHCLFAQPCALCCREFVGLGARFLRHACAFGFVHHLFTQDTSSGHAVFHQLPLDAHGEALLKFIELFG